MQEAVRTKRNQKKRHHKIPTQKRQIRVQYTCITEPHSLGTTRSAAMTLCWPDSLNTLQAVLRRSRTHPEA